MDVKPTLQELVSHVDVKTKWQRLGVLLKLDDQELEAIEQENPTSTADRVQKMYSLWLSSQPTATRRQLLEALKSVKALNTLAEDYKKWITSPSSNSRQTRSSASSRTKQTPRSLDITDLLEILTLLKNGHFNGSWETLGLHLGLYDPTLKSIKANYPRDIDICLRECIVDWLKKCDGVYEVSYVTLAKALEEMGQKSTAKYIRGCIEIPAQPEPTPATSVGSSYIAEEDDYLSHSDNEYPSTNAREQSSSETAARRRKGKDRTIQESLQPRPPPKQNKDGYDLPLGIAQDNDYKAGGATLQPKEETDFEAPAANRRLCLKDFALVIFCLVMLILLIAFCYLLDCPQSKSNTTESSLEYYCLLITKNCKPVGILGLFIIILLVAGYYLKGFACVVYCFYIVSKFLQKFWS